MAWGKLYDPSFGGKFEHTPDYLEGIEGGSTSSVFHTVNQVEDVRPGYVLSLHGSKDRHHIFFKHPLVFLPGLFILFGETFKIQVDKLRNRTRCNVLVT